MDHVTAQDQIVQKSRQKRDVFNFRISKFGRAESKLTEELFKVGIVLQRHA